MSPEQRDMQIRTGRGALEQFVCRVILLHFIHQAGLVYQVSPLATTRLGIKGYRTDTTGPQPVPVEEHFLPGVQRQAVYRFIDKDPMVKVEDVVSIPAVVLQWV